MHICLDIDDTITYAPELFVTLLAAMPEARVTIVTFRTNDRSTRKTLAISRIRFDQLILSSDPQLGQRSGQSLVNWKAGVVNAIAPDWFFEDMPEVVSRIEPNIKVFMPCDEMIRGWLGSIAEQD